MNDPHVLSRKALDCLRCNKLKDAESLVATLTSDFPEYAQGHYAASELLLRLGRADEAVNAIRRAMDLAGTDEFYQAHMINCLLINGQSTTALEMAKHMLEQTLHSPFACDTLNRVFTALGELNSAAAMAQRAAVLAPNEVHFLFNLATAQRAMGNMQEAENIYDRIIALRPMDFEAYKNRSDLRTQTRDNNHIDQLQKAQANVKDWQGEVYLYSALAKEQEDIEDYEASFAALAHANRTRRAHMHYDVSNDVETMRALRQHYALPPLHRQGCRTSEPIFILGLPRTGSTLLERILGMHSEVFAAGELQNFAMVMMKAVQSQYPNETLNRTDRIRVSTELDYTALGEDYIRSTRPRTGHCRHFIDKMPNNFLYLGLIHRALPNAKIIHLTRHPMDACFAIFKTLFKQAYPFSYDLDDLARYYCAYAELMQHWRSTLPGFVLDIAYEDLVQTPEQQLRRITEFCGLPWQTQLMEFHHNSAPTNTASASQVRQPIYVNSLQKWRHYEKQLTPLYKALETAGVNL